MLYWAAVFFIIAGQARRVRPTRRPLVTWPGRLEGSRSFGNPCFDHASLW
jgi:hypothetical protein